MSICWKKIGIEFNARMIIDAKIAPMIVIALIFMSDYREA
jgi:hypothetical protein